MAFADVVATTSDPQLGAVRLAWWREQLGALDGARASPAEPRLQAVQSELVSRGVTGAELSTLEDAWRPLIEPLPWGGPVAEGLRLRGRLLFGIGARLLRSDPHDGQVAGAIWSLADGASHCSDSESREFLLDEARLALRKVPRRIARRVRPMTAIAALAAADLLGRPAAGRVIAVAAHRMFGTMPCG